MRVGGGRSEEEAKEGRQEVERGGELEAAAGAAARTKCGKRKTAASTPATPMTKFSTTLDDADQDDRRGVDGVDCNGSCVKDRDALLHTTCLPHPLNTYISHEKSSPSSPTHHHHQ